MDKQIQAEQERCELAEHLLMVQSAREWSDRAEYYARWKRASADQTIYSAAWADLEARARRLSEWIRMGIPQKPEAWS